MFIEYTSLLEVRANASMDLEILIVEDFKIEENEIEKMKIYESKLQKSPYLKSKSPISKNNFYSFPSPRLPNFSVIRDYILQISLLRGKK